MKKPAAWLDHAKSGIFVCAYHSLEAESEALKQSIQVGSFQTAKEKFGLLAATALEEEIEQGKRKWHSINVEHHRAQDNARDRFLAPSTSP